MVGMGIVFVCVLYEEKKKQKKKISPAECWIIPWWI